MNLLYLTVLFPLLGFCLLAFSRGRLTENQTALIGVGSVGLAALVGLRVGWQFLAAGPDAGAFTQTLWQWLAVGELTANISLHLDGLSLTMLGVVSGSAS